LWSILDWKKLPHINEIGFRTHSKDVWSDLVQRSRTLYASRDSPAGHFLSCTAMRRSSDIFAVRVCTLPILTEPSLKIASQTRRVSEAAKLPQILDVKSSFK